MLLIKFSLLQIIYRVIFNIALLSLIFLILNDIYFKEKIEVNAEAST